MTRKDVNIFLPRMEEQLTKLQNDSEWVDRCISNADYIQIGLLLKILEALHEMKLQMKGQQ